MFRNRLNFVHDLQGHWGFKLVAVIWGVFGFLTLVRDNFLSPELQKEYATLNVLPRWPWYAYVIGLLVTLLLMVVEAAYHLSPHGKSATEEQAVARTPLWPIVRSNRDSIRKYLFLITGGVFCLWSLLVTETLHYIKHDMRRLHAEMVRYVLPRELTPDQIKQFGDYLRKNSESREITIAYILGDVESQRYAENIRDAFVAGNWLVDMKQISPAVVKCSAPANTSEAMVCKSDLDGLGDLLERVYVRQSGPTKQPSSFEEKLHSPPLSWEIVKGAFEAAKVEGVRGWQDLGKSSDPLNTLYLYVGPRPRDKQAVLPLGFNWRGLGTSQKLTDDDF
jgi:hypothetical protein